MRAIHKYREAARRGNREAQRRIAQSQGYQFSIYDMPDMIRLLYRAGIELEGIDYTESSTQIVDSDNVMAYDELPDTKTITF